MIRSQSENDSEVMIPDLTPLLDIIFIVMVFLLLSANIQVKTMEIDIPKSRDAATLSSVAKESLMINILQGTPTWAIEGDPIKSWDEFTFTLLDKIKAHPDRAVLIGADKQASVENMLHVLAFLQKNNINATHIQMEEK